MPLRVDIDNTDPEFHRFPASSGIKSAKLPEGATKIAQGEVQRNPGLPIHHSRPGGATELTAIGLAFIMSHTYCCSLFHCVFSTKDRRKIISPELQSRLWAYIGGIAREHSMKALAVGGDRDHVHILLSLPSSFTIAEAMRIIKSSSSRWMHVACDLKGFEWQEGYGAFSIGCSQTEATLAYIANQQEHHRERDFKAEFIAILKKHKVEYDLRYVWG